MITLQYLELYKELLQGVKTEAIRRIQLSTTISTNAIVENRISKVGVILQRGPGLKWRFDNLGEHVMDVMGSVDHRGIPVSSEGADEFSRIRENFLHHAIDAVAVVGKFSTRNPDFEKGRLSICGMIIKRSPWAIPFLGN